MNLTWVAGVFAAVVAFAIIAVIYNRYKRFKRRRKVAAYENISNCTPLFYTTLPNARLIQNWNRMRMIIISPPAGMRSIAISMSVRLSVFSLSYLNKSSQ